MTISYPRDLPEPFSWSAACKFTPSYEQTSAPTRGSLQQVANLAPDCWFMRYQTVPLNEAAVAAFEAWFSSLRGGTRLFKGWHPLREFPLAYPNGFAGLTVSGSPFTGSAVLTDVNGTLDVITIGSLPVGFVLSVGDMLSFPYASGGQSLHRVTEGAVASAGGVAAVTVEPQVPINWTDNAALLLTKAWCHAVIDAKSFDVAWQLGRKAVVSFNAMQTH